MKGIEGVKVVELCGYVAAPACPRILAEMGATIYKIEAFSGDEYRTNANGFGIEKTDVDDPAFDLASINKTWISLDIKTEKGFEVLEKLINQADIFVTSFRDKALTKLGLDYETFHQRFPKVVWAQMRGYGERGPEKDSKGFDATAYSARGGIFGSFPQAGEHYQPVNIPAAFGDWNASLALTSGILAALYRAEKTGEGDKVTVNLYHCACWAMQIGIAASQFGDIWPKSRREVRCPTNNSYKTSDNVWFLICYGSYDLFFEHTMKNIGLDNLIGDTRYDTLAEINKTGAYKDVIAMMEQTFAKHDWAYWENVFVNNDIPYAKINTISDILTDEVAYANDILRKIPYDEFGEKALVTAPIRLNSVGDPVLHRSRPIGFDTKEALNALGYSSKEIEELSNQEAVLCYSGPDLSRTIFAPIYGPNLVE